MLTWSKEAFVSALGMSLLHSLWQGALLGVVGVALQKRLKQATPDLRCGAFSLLQLTFFAVWLGTFLSQYRVAISTQVTTVSAVIGPISPGFSALSSSRATAPTLLHLLQSLSPILVTVWALGVCALSLRHLGGLLLLYRLSRTLTAPCLPAWEACAARLATQIGIGRKILLRCSTQIDVPCTFGLIKSYILLPASAMMGLQPEQAEALIAHELAHIARHDVFFNLVQICMETILFYHPTVWWLSTQIRVAREQSCDDLAVQLIGDRALYARSLYALEEARAAIPHLALGAKGDPSRMTNRHLIHRIQRVLGVSGPEKRDPWAKGALALCAAGVALTTLMPLRAYSRPTPQDPVVKQDKTVKIVTNIRIDANGDIFEVGATALTADTPVTLNGQATTFGNLTPAQQQALQQAITHVHVSDPIVHVTDGKANVTVRVQQGTDAKSPAHSKVVVSDHIDNILLDINGDKIELHTTVLKPDTRLKVNGKEGRFGDLTATQQQQLQSALKTVHIKGGPNSVKVRVQKTDDPNAPALSKVVVSETSTDILLDIKGDKIELHTTVLKPDTLLKVNGKEGRFGDLTPTQQQELQQTVKNLAFKIDYDQDIVQSFDQKDTDGKVTRFSKVMISGGGATKIILGINGDTIELNTTVLKPDTLLKVNGKEGRFGDLAPTQQQQLQDAIKKVQIHILPDDTAFGLRTGTPVAEATIKGGHPKLLVKVNGDIVELTGNTPDFSTENLPADTLVKINGKESRFGDLSPAQQEAIRATKASIHVNVSSDDNGATPPAPPVKP